MKRALLLFVSACFGAACLFFAWYTIRLVWVNLTAAGIEQHRQAGMYIGAVAFPLATCLFGYVAWRCWTWGKRA